MSKLMIATLATIAFLPSAISRVCAPCHSLEADRT